MRKSLTATVLLAALIATAVANAEPAQEFSFEIKDVKTIRLPELTAEYVEEEFGLKNAEQLDEMIKTALERNLESTQRRAARMQVLSKIAAASTWELPADLLERQYRRARARRIMEMRGDGLADAEIAKQLRVMEQDIHQSTALALKEHFVLQKIAEVEKIEADVNHEVETATEACKAAPNPPMDILFTDVYADGGWAWRN